MAIDENTLDQLLHEEEGAALDFKRDQYPFEKADEDAKSELLKDILAFTNAWRRTTAYILIGVSDVKGGRSEIIGVQEHLDDARLHQFVNSKTQRPIEFSYQPYQTGTVEIGVLEIPRQERPIYLKKDFGKLRGEIVYKRDGSSTAIATPDEIASMGAERNHSGPPELLLEWADIESRTVLPSPFDAEVVLLDPVLPEDTFKEARGMWSLSLEELCENQDYSREVIEYTFRRALHRSIGFRLSNRSGRVGRRIIFVGSIPEDRAVSVLDGSSQATPPSRNRFRGVTSGIVPFAERLKKRPEPKVRCLSDRWEITIDFGDVRPHDEIWTTEPLLIGARSGRTELSGELRGDNLAEPVRCALGIQCEVVERPMTRADVEPHLE